MREYSATVGDTDGNIIPAIITTETPRNQRKGPRPVHGPSSMPRMRSRVDHQAAPASANRTATSPSRVRAAANAVASPALPAARSCAEAVTGSGRAGEPGLREPGLALVLDAERADPGALRL